MATQMRVRFYREFLTPALHRRFTRAASTILVACYVESFIIGDKSSLFWSWFPLGSTGFRALLLFVTCLMVFILRVSTLHMAARTAAAPFNTFASSLLRWSTLQILGQYLFSAWWFSEVYVWSAPRDSDLAWLAEGKAYERRRLNERPIYLRSHFFMLAIVQSFIHIYNDYDRVVLPIPKVEAKNDVKPIAPVPALEQLRAKMPSIVSRIVFRGGVMTMSSLVIYALFIRQTAWNWSLSFARIVWDVSKASEPSFIPPYHYTLIIRSMVSGVLLLGLWELSNEIFSIYVATEPLKRGNPLTSDSRDPNGSLLNGLNSKRETVKAFAFWELFLISSSFADRRKSIFSDIDRTGGQTWAQTLAACLALINTLTFNINEFKNPSTALPPSSTPPPPLESLPRISSPLKTDPIFTSPTPPTTSRGKLGSAFGNAAKSLGQSPPSSRNSPVSPRRLFDSATKLLANGAEGQQQSTSLPSPSTFYTPYLTQFLSSPLGIPFRQTIPRRANTIVLGPSSSNATTSPSPSALDLSTVIHAISAIANLAVASLKEDPYGMVVKDIPAIVRVFTKTIRDVEGFVGSLERHWTDVDGNEGQKEKGKQRVEEIDVLVAHLKAGLGKVLEGFGEFATDVGLSYGEVREARNLVAS